MSSFPTDTFTGKSGDLDVMLPLLWGSKINDFFKKKLVMGNFFTNRSDELTDGGYSVYTPGMTEMSANTKSNATAVTLRELGVKLTVRLKQSIMVICHTYNVTVAA